MKARELILQLTTLALQNPQVLDQEVEIVSAADQSSVNPVQVELSYGEMEPEDEAEGTMAEPVSLVITTL